jgi:hypothetical protein
VLPTRPLCSRRKSALLGLGVISACLGIGPSAAAAPSLADRLEARTICVSERGAGDPFKKREFRRLYGGRRAFRRCVRFHVRQVAIERRLELPTIMVECRLEARATPVAFRLDFPGGVRQCVRFEALP